MKNFDRIKYTTLHRRAITAIINEYIKEEDKKEMLRRAKIHDMDKTLMNLLDLPYGEIKKIHRENTTHHYQPGMSYTRYDYLEMIIDWESARYTKDDKPVNAYNTMINYYPDLIEPLTPLLKELNLYTENDEKNPNVTKQIDLNVTEEDIEIEVNEYVNEYLLRS